MRSVRALEGIAWLTQGGRDVVCRSGERVDIVSRRGDPPLISGIGRLPLVVEILA